VDIALWIAQIVLALGLLAVGFTHATRVDQATGRQIWMKAVPRPLMTTIGVLEILGAIGLVLPGLTGVQPWLTPLAASLVVVLIIFAIAFHARRPGELPNIAFAAIFGAIAAFIAYGRYVLEPF
jgi:uncharacterized membrane protein